MREIVVVDWCDNTDAHPDPDKKVRAHFIDLPVKIGDEEAVLALCDRCYLPLNAVLTLMAFGVNPKARKQRNVVRPRVDASDTNCPECAYVGPSRSALGLHTRTHHGKGLKEYRVSS